MFRAIIFPIYRSKRLCVTACGIMHPRCCRPVAGRQHRGCAGGINLGFFCASCANIPQTPLPKSATKKIALYGSISLILRRSRKGTVWFYTSTSNKRAARPKLYTKSLTMDLKCMYSRLTLVRISIKL